MMLPITGTVRDAVKLAELDNKWKQKKNSAEKMKKELTPEERQIQRYQEDAEKMRESRQMAALDAKLEAGAGLTPEEIAYLRKNHPLKYKDYLETKEEQKHYKEELEACETKDDVEKLKMTKLGEFAAECKSVANNPNIPEGKKVELLGKILKKIAGVEKVHTEFVKSLRYQSLPTEEEEAEEKQTDTEMENNPSEQPSQKTETENNISAQPSQEIESAEENGISMQSIQKADMPKENERGKESALIEADEQVKEYTGIEMDLNFEKIEAEIKEYIKPYRA